MRQTIDQVLRFPENIDTIPATLRPPIQGQYRVRVYEEEGRAPEVVVTDATPGAPNPPLWLSNYAPRLARPVARDYLASHDDLHWITLYPTSDEEKRVKGAIFERTLFKIVGDREVIYDERFRASTSPPIEPQAAFQSQADVEALIGQPLD